jgi:phosphoserine phosphatase
MVLVLTGEDSARNAVLQGMTRAGHAPRTVELTATGKSLRLMGLAASSELSAVLERLAAEHRVDYAFVPEGARLADFGLLALDMDSTLITIECIDEIARLYGVETEVARLTEAAMQGQVVDYAASLGQRMALLAGAPVAILESVYAERLELSPGATELLEAAREAGLKSLLVSGGFTFFLERLQARLKLDFIHANTLEIRDDRLTGGLIGPIVDASAKAEILQRTCKELGIEPDRAIVIGDGANDLKMLALAGMDVAYHAKPVVRRAAGHAIQFGGLDVVLEWLGA